MDGRTIRLALLFAILGMTAICVFVVWDKFHETQPQTTIVDRKEELEKTPVKPPVVVPPVVQKINARNAKIKGLAVEELTAKVWEGGMRFRLKGSLHYLKPKFFRMKIKSVLGEELDLGATNELFWYWSRRDERPGLYFAYYEDYNKTRLKTPFNPVFLRGSMGLDIIDMEGAQVVEKDKDMMLVYQMKNSMGKPVLKSIFINKETERVEGYLITDIQGKPVASCEIQNFVGNVPQRVLYTWHTEDKILLLDFDEPQIVDSLPDSHWQMPNHKPKINMAEE